MGSIPSLRARDFGPVERRSRLRLSGNDRIGYDEGMLSSPSLFVFTALLAMPALVPLTVSAEVQRHLGCDLSKKESLPKIVLVGETHADPQARKTRDRILTDGAKGKYPVGSEVAHTAASYALAPNKAAVTIQALGGKPETAALHGIESEIPHGVHESYKIMLDLFDQKIEPVAAAALIIGRDVANDNALFSSALVQANTQLQSSGTAKTKQMVREVLAALDQDKATGTNNGYFLKLADILRKYDNEAYVEFARAHHKALINIVNSRYLDRFDGKPFATTLNKREAVSNQMDPNYVRMLIHHRDRDFSYNVGDLLCRYSGQASHLFVVVGGAHMDGMETWLKRLAGGKADVLKLISTGDKDLGALEREIKASKYTPKPMPASPARSGPGFN